MSLIDSVILVFSVWYEAILPLVATVLGGGMILFKKTGWKVLLACGLATIIVMIIPAMFEAKFPQEHQQFRTELTRLAKE